MNQSCTSMSEERILLHFFSFVSSRSTSMETDLHQRCETPPVSSTSSTTMISPVMNVVSSPSAASPIVPSIMTKTTTSPSSMILPTSPQSQTSSNGNNKRKCSTPSNNPNRFDGASEEELSKRLLSDILQPNLDIVFVRHRHRLFFALTILFRWASIPVSTLYIKDIITVDQEIIFGNYCICQDSFPHPFRLMMIIECHNME